MTLWLFTYDITPITTLIKKLNWFMLRFIKVYERRKMKINKGKSKVR